MNRLILLNFCFSIFGIINAGIPSELSRLLEQKDSETDIKTTIDKIRSEPDSFNLDFSQSTSEEDEFEEAWKKLGGKSIHQYRPPPITTVECHVEYQLTKRVPGRCIRLAGNIPACQTEEFIGLNYKECR